MTIDLSKHLLDGWTPPASWVCSICRTQSLKNQQNSTEPTAESTTQKVISLCGDPNHFHHITCMIPWLYNNSTCPTCRRSMNQDLRTAIVQRLNVGIDSTEKLPEMLEIHRENEYETLETHLSIINELTKFREDVEEQAVKLMRQLAAMQQAARLIAQRIIQEGAIGATEREQLAAMQQAAQLGPQSIIEGAIGATEAVTDNLDEKITLGCLAACLAVKRNSTNDIERLLSSQGLANAEWNAEYKEEVKKFTLFLTIYGNATPILNFLIDKSLLSEDDYRVAVVAGLKFQREGREDCLLKLCPHISEGIWPFAMIAALVHKASDAVISSLAAKNVSQRTKAYLREIVMEQRVGYDATDDEIRLEEFLERGPPSPNGQERDLPPTS
jgi:hypothetical protein